MKRIYALFLTALFALALAGCGREEMLQQGKTEVFGGAGLPGSRIDVKGEEAQ